MNDLISRQAAIDALGGNDIVTSRESAQAVMDYIRGCADRIRSLPSAQPDLDEWCTDCKEYDSERHCCPRFNRVIRETLKDAQPEIIYCEECKHYNAGFECLIEGYGIERNKDWFCGDAERRTDETTI